MAYSFDQVFAADPANPANIASNAAITIYQPGDSTKTPLVITDPSGGALTNPIPVNANGFGSAFMHATLDRVAWDGGGFTGFFTSYEGMKNEAVDARTAAQEAAATAGADAAAVATTAIGDATAEAEAAATAAANSATAAVNAAALVGAPADSAIAAAVNGTGATKTALSAAYATTARDTGDTFQSVNRRLNYVDIANAKGSVINIDHRGDGTGNTANPGQAYGIDIHNYPGAATGLTMHQYSFNGPLVWLDNTDNQPLIRLHNTQNTTLNPGRDGTGDFIQFQDHGVEIMRLDKDLVLRTQNGTKTLTILNTVAKAFSVQQASSYAGSGHAMEVIKSATGTGSALDVTNAGTGKGVYIRQNGAATGLQIDAGASAAGLYPLVVTGQDYGPNITTATNGGVSLNVTKNGTGAGDAVKVTNKGTGNALSIHNTAGTRIARIGPNGALITANSTAPILADLADGETALWRDATTGDLKVTSRTAGALKTATLAVA